MTCCIGHKTRRLVQRTVQGKKKKKKKKKKSYFFQRYGSGKHLNKRVYCNTYSLQFIVIHTVFSLSHCVLVGKMLTIMSKTENKQTNSDPENKQNKGYQSNALYCIHGASQNSVNLTNSLTSVARPSDGTATCETKKVL